MGRSDITLEKSTDMHPKPRPNRDWRRIIPGLIISAVSLGAVLYFADLRRLLEALRLANYALVGLVILSTVLWLLVRTMMWRTLLMERAPFRDTFLTLNEGYLINNLLPLRLGEIARAFLLSRKTDLNFWEVFSSILIERSMDLAMAVGVLLVSLPFVVGGSWAQQAALAGGSIVLVVFVALYLLARNQERALHYFRLAGERLPFLMRIAGRAVPEFISGLTVLTHGRHFFKAVGWLLINWLVAILQYYVILRAYITNVQLLWATFGLGVSALGVAAPSSPGAVGVMELSVVGALSVFGLDASIALAAALTLHLIQYLTTGIIGGYALFRDGESLVGLYNRVRRMKDEETKEQTG